MVDDALGDERGSVVPVDALVDGHDDVAIRLSLNATGSAFGLAAANWSCQ